MSIETLIEDNTTVQREVIAEMKVLQSLFANFAKAGVINTVDKPQSAVATNAGEVAADKAIAAAAPAAAKKEKATKKAAAPVDAGAAPEAKKLTAKYVADNIMLVASSVSRDAAMAIIGKFNVQKISQIPEANWVEANTAALAALEAHKAAKAATQEASDPDALF